MKNFCQAMSAETAAGLLRLYPLLKSPEIQAKYFKATTAALRSLTAAPYFSEGEDKASLVAYAARNYHADPDHKLTNTSLIWSDYYLLQALLRYQRITSPPSQ